MPDNTNWRAMQAPRDKKDKTAPAIAPHGVKTKYMTMGSFHADASKSGASRKAFRVSL